MITLTEIKIFLFVLLVHSGIAAQNCSSLSGIINTYAPVTNISGNVITRGTTTGATAPFVVGDYVVLIQMTGIPPAHATSNMGKYELRTITAVSGTSITLSSITNTYTFSTEKVQLIRAPYCPTGTISATVTARVWDGTTGGVIAIKGETLSLNADIDATGTGFSQINPPTSATSTPSLSTGLGSTDGRGFSSTPSSGAAAGGGGIGGGGGAGGVPTGASTLAGSVGGGAGAIAISQGIRGGGGGGIIGGGGGGGGVNSSGVPNGAGSAGGGGGVGGGGGGGGALGGGGGGVKGVSNGTNYHQPDSGGGAGGGSYGGGGGAASAWLGGDDSYAGGGGGSWTGGGCRGESGSIYNKLGGAGNNPVSVVIDNNSHYLNTNQPRLMMGGSGGNAFCQSGGFGGGIIIMEVTTVNGNNRIIRSNGEAKGLAPLCNVTSSTPSAPEGAGGAGGGGGGQMLLKVNNFANTNLNVSGGKGGDGNYNPSGSGSLWHGGVGGAGGGGGGIWLQGTTTQTNTGGNSVTITGVNSIGASGGISGLRTNNPKNGIQTGTGGCGGNGLVIVSLDVPAWPNEICAITNFTATPGACTPSNNQYSVSGSLSFSNAPATGTLTVLVGSVTQTFNAPFTSPQVYTLTGLTSGSGSQTVTAVFSADASCTASQTYTVPTSCQCVISSITAAPGACSTNNNSYTLTGQVTFTNAPTAGTLIISVSGGNSVTLTAPFTTSVPYSISNLNADGMSHTVTATFSDDILCTNMQSYTAPVQCAIPCPPSNFNFCGGDTYTLTAPAGYSGYQWYTVGGMTETPLPGATSNVYIATMPGTYIYRAIDGGACAIHLCCPVTLNDVRPLLSCTGTVIPSCGQSNGSATVSVVGGAGGYTYRWSTTPQQTSATATNLAAGTYIVTVTDSGGCSNTCQVVLTPPNSPTSLASVVSVPGCNLINGSAMVTASGGNGIYTYLWSTLPIQTTQTAVGLGVGSYTVTVTDGNMCSNTSSVTLNSPSSPTCSSTANTQPTCANLTGGSAAVIVTGGSGSYTYTWSNGMSGATVTGLVGGTYTVTVTDSNNCQSTCQVTIETPQNCCNISVISQISVCDDNGTPSKATDNRIRATVLVTNENAALTNYTISVGQGTTVTPAIGVYGVPNVITLGPGTGGGGASFLVTFTDLNNGSSCIQTLNILDPGNCEGANTPPVCPTPKCGTATIQVNGN